MGKLVLLVGGPGSGKSKKLRDMFMGQTGSARFLECRHKPESISHVFVNHSTDKQVGYLDNLEELPDHVATGDGPVFIDAPNLSVTQLLALASLATAYDVSVHVPLRLAPDGSHAFLRHMEKLPSVEFLAVE
jgi:predicted kinase